jgi:hypothetical protein
MKYKQNLYELFQVASSFVHVEAIRYFIHLNVEGEVFYGREHFHFRVQEPENVFLLDSCS